MLQAVMVSYYLRYCRKIADYNILSILFLGQLWMLDGTTLMNRGGIWQSSEQWNFQPKDGKIIVENTSKNKVLGIKDKDKVIKEDFTKNETKQWWMKVESDIEGFFKLESFESKKFLRAKVNGKYKHNFRVSPG